MALRPLTSAPRAISLAARPFVPVVLCVEDNPDIWEVTQLHLKRRFNLMWATNAAAACQIIRAHHQEISTILMDIELQGSELDGVELTRLLRGRELARPLPDFAQELPPLDAPIFFVTAFAGRYAEEELRAAGGDRLIAKPVDFAQLSLALAQAHLRRQSSPVYDLLALAADLDVSESELNALIASEPILAERVERLNATSLFPTPIAARAAALVLSVVDLSPSSVDSSALMNNCLRRGAAALLLAPHFELETGECLAVGLLLDSGLLTRAQHDLDGALRVGRSPALARIVWENAADELEHPTRGATLAQDWALSQDVISAVRNHHSRLPPEGKLGKTMWLAERIAAVFEAGDHSASWQRAQADAQGLGIEESVVLAMAEAMPGVVQQLAVGLECSVEATEPLESLLRQTGPSLAALAVCYQELIHTLAALTLEKNSLTRRLQATNTRLSEEATTDALTQLSNRRALDEVLDREIARTARINAPLSIILLDIDRFKEINDCHGHATGDEVLRRLGEVLRSTLREDDSCGRYGGEEFLIVMPGAPAHAARRVAERLRTNIEALQFKTPSSFSVTASFGVHTVDPVKHAVQRKTVLERADKALYEAKRSGRNCVRTFGEDQPELG